MLEVIIWLAIIPLALAGLQIVLCLLGACIIAIVNISEWVKSKLFGDDDDERD